jgi:hypothetical protein
MTNEPSLRSRADRAIDLILNYGQDDGSHHKMWVIDQVLRKLAGTGYDAMITEYCEGEDGPDTYEWDTGVAP